MADQQAGNLKPVTPARVAEELRKLSTQRANGQLKPDEYEHRFARMISELRDRRIDGSRADILANLTSRGTVKPTMVTKTSTQQAARTTAPASAPRP